MKAKELILCCNCREIFKQKKYQATFCPKCSSDILHHVPLSFILSNAYIEKILNYKLEIAEKLKEKSER